MKVSIHLNRTSDNGDVFGIGTVTMPIDGVVLLSEHELAQAVAQAFHDLDPRVAWDEAAFVALLWKSLRKA